MTRTIPRILIAGAHSGSGKTSLTLGLISALRRRGVKVQPFKVGPDYLDPTWLTAASGRPCYNLDGWMSGRDYVERLFGRVTQDADVAVIEGVMGLFDGAQASGISGSSAEIAKWLQAPVVLVVNAHGMGRSIAPLVAGFAAFESGVSVRGIIANHCGSENHRILLCDALAASRLPALIGAVPRQGLPELRSRHLGLMTADPVGNCSPELLDEFAVGVERYLDLDEVMKIARSASPLLPLSPGPANEEPSPNPPICLAVARDEAFHFYYQDLFDELVQRGCRPVFFSPLRETSLPQGIDAIYLGGGYPEAFAETLGANKDMRHSLQQFARSGRPVYAECGGLIYLSQALTTREGKRYPLLGVLPGETRMLDRRKRLGYVEVSLREDTLWGKTGTRLRGHEFHYSELISDDTSRDGWSAAYDVKTCHGAYESREGFYKPHGRILASYIHLHLASRPSALVHFLNVCARARLENRNQLSLKFRTSF
jgi:cobyrinic acid a,c-diamide synthase